MTEKDMERWNSQMPRYEIRPITQRAELEKALDLWGTVFSVGREFFRKRLDYDTSYELQTTWIGSIDGDMAASVQIFPYGIRLGDAKLTVGGIGSVASDPRFRGKGLVHAILREQSEWMKASGYDLSLLFTGIHPFYQKVGWHTVPEPVYELDASGIGPLPHDSAHIRPFAAADLDNIMALSEAYNAANTNSRIRDNVFWDGLLQWEVDQIGQFLVAEQGGQIAAYVMADKPKDGKLGVMEFAYLEAEPMKELFAWLCAAEDVNTLTVQAPDDGIVPELLKALGPVSVQMKDHSMWKILRLTEMFQKLEPTLTKRIASLSSDEFALLPEKLLVRCDDQQTILLLDPQGVKALPVSVPLVYDEELRCTSGELAALLLQGAQGDALTNTIDSAVLRLLFPRQRYAMWRTENF